MKPVHMNPDEAVRAHLDVRARVEHRDALRHVPAHRRGDRRTACARSNGRATTHGVSAGRVPGAGFRGDARSSSGQLVRPRHRHEIRDRRRSRRPACAAPTPAWRPASAAYTVSSVQCRGDAREALRGSSRYRRRSRAGNAPGASKKRARAERDVVLAHQRDRRTARRRATPRMRGKTIVPADGTHSSSRARLRGTASASALLRARIARARASSASRCSKASTASRSATIEPVPSTTSRARRTRYGERRRGDRPSRRAGSTARTTSSGCWS